MWRGVAGTPVSDVCLACLTDCLFDACVCASIGPIHKMSDMGQEPMLEKEGCKQTIDLSAEAWSSMLS